MGDFSKLDKRTEGMILGGMLGFMVGMFFTTFHINKRLAEGKVKGYGKVKELDY